MDGVKNEMVIFIKSNLLSITGWTVGVVTSKAAELEAISTLLKLGLTGISIISFLVVIVYNLIKIKKELK